MSEKEIKYQFARMCDEYQALCDELATRQSNPWAVKTLKTLWNYRQSVHDIINLYVLALKWEQDRAFMGQ